MYHAGMCACHETLLGWKILTWKHRERSLTSKSTYKAINITPPPFTKSLLWCRSHASPCVLIAFYQTPGFAIQTELDFIFAPCHINSRFGLTLGYVCQSFESCTVLALLVHKDPRRKSDWRLFRHFVPKYALPHTVVYTRACVWRKYTKHAHVHCGIYHCRKNSAHDCATIDGYLLVLAVRVGVSHKDQPSPLREIPVHRLQYLRGSHCIHSCHCMQ